MSAEHYNEIDGKLFIYQNQSKVFFSQQYIMSSTIKWKMKRKKNLLVIVQKSLFYHINTLNIQNPKRFSQNIIFRHATLPAWAGFPA